MLGVILERKKSERLNLKISNFKKQYAKCTKYLSSKIIRVRSNIA